MSVRDGTYPDLATGQASRVENALKGKSCPKSLESRVPDSSTRIRFRLMSLSVLRYRFSSAGVGVVM